MATRATVEKVMQLSEAYGVVHVDGKRQNLRPKRIGPAPQVGDEVDLQRVKGHGGFIEEHDWHWASPEKRAEYQRAVDEDIRQRTEAAETASHLASDPRTREWEGWIQMQISAQTHVGASEVATEAAFALLKAADDLLSLSAERSDDDDVPTFFGSPPPMPYAFYSQATQRLSVACREHVRAWTESLSFDERVAFIVAYRKRFEHVDRSLVEHAAMTTSVRELAELGVQLGPSMSQIAGDPRLWNAVCEVCLCDPDFRIRLPDGERFGPRFVPLLSFDGTDWHGLYVYPPARSSANAPDPLISVWDSGPEGEAYRATSFAARLLEMLDESATDPGKDDARTTLRAWLSEQPPGPAVDVPVREDLYEAAFVQAAADELPVSWEPKDLEAWFDTIDAALSLAEPNHGTLIDLEAQWCTRWHAWFRDDSGRFAMKMLKLGRRIYIALGWEYPARVLTAWTVERGGEFEP